MGSLTFAPERPVLGFDLMVIMTLPHSLPPVLTSDIPTWLLGVH